MEIFILVPLPINAVIFGVSGAVLQPIIGSVLSRLSVVQSMIVRMVWIMMVIVMLIAGMKTA